MEYLIKQYALEQGALEIQYIEEEFGEFPRRKTAAEIVRRLDGRPHIILMAEAPHPNDPGIIVPVSYKVFRPAAMPLYNGLSRNSRLTQFERSPVFKCRRSVAMPFARISRRDAGE